RINVCWPCGLLRRGSVGSSLRNHVRRAKGQAQKCHEKSKKVVFHGGDSRLLSAGSPVLVRDRGCQPLANFGRNIPVCLSCAANVSPTSCESKDSRRRA